MSGIQGPAIGNITTTLAANSSVNVNQVGGAAIALGQALAASSIPVVLTAAQVTTLTPLSTITTVTTVSNVSQIASVTPTFGDVTNATAVTGAINDIPVGIYNTTPAAISAGRYNEFQLDARGNLRNTIMDAAGNARGVNITASNEMLVNINNNPGMNIFQVAGNGTSTAASGTQLVGIADGAGNKVTSNSTATSGKIAPDVNILSILGTAPTAAGKLDVKAADGDVFVRSNSATTFPTQATLQTQTDTVMVGGVNIKEINAVAPLMGVGATGTGALRVVLANDQGKTLVSKGGSAGSSGDNTLVTAGTNKLKVYAFSLSTVSTTAVTCIFQSGASGTELWRVVLQTPTNVAGGANLSIQPPAWLFATASATLLNLNLSGAVTVHWSCSYFDEA